MVRYQSFCQTLYHKDRKTDILSKTQNYSQPRSVKITKALSLSHKVEENTGIQLGKFTMHYVRSKDNVADIFTKCADPITFRRLRWILMGGGS